jgi:hypothetical protein
MLRAFSKVRGTFGTAAVLLAFTLPAGPAAGAVGKDEGATCSAARNLSQCETNRESDLGPR